MIKIFLIILAAAMMGVSSCQTIQYEDDIRFLNSAQANSPEFFGKVNGKVCKDLDGLVGLCTLRVKSNETVTIEQLPQDYSYRLDMECTRGTGIQFGIDVPKGKAFKYEIKPESFEDFLLFSCEMEITPFDRDNSISAIWHTRFFVVDKNYQGREVIYYQDGHLVLGKFARNSRVCTEDGCKRYTKKTIIKTKKPVFATSQSAKMRMNYFEQ